MSKFDSRKYKNLDWVLLQKEYDNLLTLREICKKFNISQCIILRANKNGKFKLRNKSEASLAYIKKNGGMRKQTQETKDKLSKIRKEFLEKNPDKIPYLLNHYSKQDSYPEIYFKELFEKENISLKHHKQVGLYQLDFYDDGAMIDVEIDGEQHYVDQRIIESDKRRTKYLSDLGWKVYRIRWSTWNKMDFESKHKIVLEIKSLLGD